ncbi:unnamed protein product [Vitrella brassicaformis CCMP3155]|uniref:EF-hand domain-containing protein n=1 Tax=Vitrella brassicaformis (strain CCMP3155) TaxID=1169540 RepID=A0A0G4GLF9_VITBC|nr:unnamed protein product [Vitrella brassicaformis CCMP3155]|eukprot:CEM30956.1 unnamed protein product [Vitrella brassicaformis CCMP3155]
MSGPPFMPPPPPPPVATGPLSPSQPSDAPPKPTTGGGFPSGGRLSITNPVMMPPPPVFGGLGPSMGGSRGSVNLSTSKGPPGSLRPGLPGPEQTSQAFVIPGIQERDYADEEIKQAFDTFDLDNNRFVGAAEIRHILDLIGEKASDEEIDEMIRMIDIDGDGQVTYDEFYKLVKSPPVLWAADPNAVGAAGVPVPPSPLRMPGDLGSSGRVPPPPQAPPPLPGTLPPPAAAAAPMSVLGASVGSSGQQQQPNTFASLFKSSKSEKDTTAKRKEDDAAIGGGGGGGGLKKIDREAIMQEFSKQKALKPAYIKKVYKKFQEMDDDKSGLIDYDEFCKVLDTEPSPLMRRVFDMFDADGSGSLELKEFIVGLSSFTSASKTDKLKFAFMMFDEDCSGFIDRKELIKILRANFVASNAQSDAEIEKKADQIFESLGLPAQTGKISMEHFLQLSKKSAGLLFPAIQLATKIDATLGR